MASSEGSSGPFSKKTLLREISYLSNICTHSSKTRPSERLVPPELESTGVTLSNLVGISLSEVLVMMDRWREVVLRELCKSWY